ncbi:hypothetical protein BEWA_021940 [Theileria equi strain WA]|uniref:FUZ/MON1/HPS1 first Longin domain-containing protein n=1 Tax=Theileria equi strain WA TaxID=1537102 RepID=L0AWD9_THEEQ|nr:hypothetical protein BEWA_021940 [Theileria equi strain WA]AFZ79346.1 hypothetical protein BEWA_021940 [Theileria equi strain WA]|eukprot:XP_004829012.1 hypothetical protein BEWA_021940 [Theileria equi strain WA]
MALEVYGFTYAGKPLFSSCKDSEVSLTFYGTLSAIVSKVASLLSDYTQEDSLRYITAGRHQFVYLERGPLCYFGISKGTYTPLTVYRILSTIHLQVISILTRGVERILLKRPSYDVQNLLGGTQFILQKLVDNLGGCLGILDTSAYEALPLSQSSRDQLATFFTNFKTDNILCALLVVSDRVAVITTAKRVVLNPKDIIIVINTIIASQSLQQQENWTPICLPSYNDQAFTYAYIKYIEPGVGVVCISTRGDQEQFYILSGHLEDTSEKIIKSKCMDEVRTSLLETPLTFPSGEFKKCEILHVLYHSLKLGQFFSSSFYNLTYGDFSHHILSSYRMVSELLHSSTHKRAAMISFEHINVYAEYNTDYVMYMATAPWTEITTELVEKVAGYIYKHFSFLFITKTPTITMN